MEGWREISRTPALRLPKNSPPLKPGQQPLKMITTITFDDSHELIWVGDSDGYVYSYNGIKLTPYTSVRAHTSAVIKILNHKKGIVSLSSDSVRFGTREGITKFVLKSDNDLNGLACMSYTSNTQTELLVAGSAQLLNNRIIKIDLLSGSISGHIDYSGDVMLMDTNLKYVVLGKVDGFVDILDPRASTIVKTFKAHSASLSTISVKDNFLVTTGYSLRHDQYIPDPLVNTFDLKNLTTMTPVTFPMGAAHAHLHSRLPNVTVVVSNMGQINFIDIFNPSSIQLYQAELTSFLALSDMSASGACFAFTDAMQNLYLWSNSNNMLKPPSFVVYSTPLIYPTKDDEIIPMSNRLSYDFETPLNSIKLPHYNTMLLSAWPAEMKFETGKVPAQIDPEILRSCKTIDGFTIARYNKEKYGHRNVVHNYEPLFEKNQNDKFPKFISERDDDDEEDEHKVKLKHDKMKSAFISISPNGDVPNSFKKVDILYSKFGVDDFDFDFYNTTRHAGLETHVDNSYCNAILQLYRFIPSIFNFVVKTLAEDVSYDDSVLAELGYLFDMLVKANGKHCAASNFQKLFTSLPDAKRLGLIDNDGKPKDDYGQRRLIQTFNRFLLEKLSLDEKVLYNSNLSFHLNSICGVLTETSVTSMFCKLDHKRTSIFHSIDVNTIPPPPLIPTDQTILKYMEASMNKVIQHRILCENCKTQHNVDAALCIGALPPVVTLNLDLNNEQMNEIRNHKNWLVPEFYATTSPSGRPILRTNVIAGGSTNLKKYELMGYVAQITSRDSVNHLVTMIKINDSNDGDNSKCKWHLLNDFLVTDISEEEVLNLSYWWKRPVVVIYKDSTIGNTFSYEDWKSSIDDSILYRDHFAKGTREDKIIEYELLTSQEAPKPGTLVAIDAEFVQLSPDEYEFKANGTRTLMRPRKLTLARVSVLRGEGPKEGKAFIDDYILTNESQIDDYITSFSGIEAGDLDPNTSNKTVVTLQTAYRKMWLLLNLGCVFVGHSLGGDFRTINIQIPPRQVRDTAEFFYLKKEKRKLGLKFLIYQLFNDKIQTGNHDSIEDALGALKLYKKYLELKENGQLESTLNRIYLEGQFSRFKVPS